MIYIQPGMFVRIEQLLGERAPQPLPLVSGFREDTAYKVLGIYNPSETGEAYFILANEADQIWFISIGTCVRMRCYQRLRNFVCLSPNSAKEPRPKPTSREVARSLTVVAEAGMSGR